MKLLAAIITLKFTLAYCNLIDVVENLSSFLLIQKNYNKNVRPLYQTNIEFEMSVNQLVNIDEKNEIMTSSCYLKMKWQDTRMSWDTNTFNVDQILVPATSLWLPDAYVINTAEASGFVSITSSNYALINSEGVIYLVINLSALKTRCSINVSGFPYDNQTCTIVLGSWQYDNSRLIFSANDTVLNTANYVTNPTWILKNTTALDSTTNTRFDNSSGLASTDVVFYFFIKRRPTNYMLNNLLPCFLLNIITLITFWIPFMAAFNASKFNKNLRFEFIL